MKLLFEKAYFERKKDIILQLLLLSLLLSLAAVLINFNCSGFLASNGVKYLPFHFSLTNVIAYTDIHYITSKVPISHGCFIKEGKKTFSNFLYTCSFIVLIINAIV